MGGAGLIAGSRGSIIIIPQDPSIEIETSRAHSKLLHPALCSHLEVKRVPPVIAEGTLSRKRVYGPKEIALPVSNTGSLLEA